MRLSLVRRAGWVTRSLRLMAGVFLVGCFEQPGDAPGTELPPAAVEEQNLQLRPLKKGDAGAQVRWVHDYLKRYGYFPNPALEQHPGWSPALGREPAKPEVFDEVTEEALRLFQGAHGLQVDGTLSQETLQLMQKPRCGFPDLYGGNVRGHQGGVSAQYVAQGSKWGTSNITYSFANYTPDMGVANSRAALQGALARWAAVTTFNFTEVASGGDIVIGWYSGDHGDGYPFDGPSNTLAHAFYPAYGGDLHFDEAETWRDDGGSGFDLPSVALHELGHSLGLAHSSDTSAVMYAYYSGWRRNMRADDVHGIISIYGVRAVASWWGAGPIAGKYCTQIHESADPHAWQDNYFCMDTYQGVQWSGAGPIAGMRCTQILEASDPDTWNDNYLCVPSSSPYYFSWSSGGPILGRQCVQWHEFSDPHTWDDNFLCY